MKIFIDCRWYSQPGQGVVTYLAGLHAAAESLKRKFGIEFWYGIESLESIPAGILPKDAKTIVLGKKGLFWRLFVMPIFLSRHKFDAAHFQYVCPLYRLNTAYVTTIHDVLFFQFPELFTIKYKIPRKILFYLSAKISNLILTVSEQSAEAIKKYLHPAHDPSIIYNSFANTINIPEEKQVPSTLLSPKDYLLTVGRIEPRKNYALLARAFEKAGLHARGAKLAIVGFCSPEFHAELDKLKKTPGVTVLDRVTDEQLSWLYHNARGFIYPSICEGFGIPVLEALSAQVPCAVSNTFPISDILNGVSLTFNPGDVDGMTKALDALWSGKVPCSAVSLQKYTWEKSAQKYMEELSMLSLR
ncbi:MAG: hypothetical protein RLY71_1372 [Pseudomonadota bacterium]|jgi:glycosyltransferase involved in cell wall biosynthesis